MLATDVHMNKYSAELTNGGDSKTPNAVNLRISQKNIRGLSPVFLFSCFRAIFVWIQVII